MRERVLTLPLKGIYFDQIAAGTKRVEYRVFNDYWCRRLIGRIYDRIVLTKGYPRADDAERRLNLPWHGFTTTTITHEHFGPEPVKVFAIFVYGDERAAAPVERGGQ
ncbi:ASCH domain-containing protein [Paraburkholderia sp. SARCC-3016]|uniref:ASCH domain-containing protein n=1 Tax=Paraburkholderia sp. SARCC-3016 TaxID=3058611 RepID=UPI00280752F9|nr:ASCH domain-containing protein [Paraburkholderia sp. SARCC-3016]MDQ7981927.1 ASCH domain-containing protein [Paraburkholderia sp. SARCC-3016]